MTNATMTELKRSHLLRQLENNGVTVSFTVGTESKWDKFEMEVSTDELRKAVQIAKGIR